MKTIIVTALLCCMLSSATAQDSTATRVNKKRMKIPKKNRVNGEDDGNAGKDSSQVLAAIEQLRSAMISGNKAELEAIASDKLSYGHSGGKVEDKASFVETIVSGRSDFVTIDLKEQTIVVSGKTAVVRHTLVAQSNDNGKPGNVTLKVMLVFQKQQGKWLMLARQAVKMPG